MFSIPRSSSFLFFEADFDVDEEVVEDILAVCELNCKLLGVLSIWLVDMREAADGIGGGGVCDFIRLPILNWLDMADDELTGVDNCKSPPFATTPPRPIPILIKSKLALFDDESFSSFVFIAESMINSSSI